MGAIASGKRLFGKVDVVRGKYHVATLCWHFCYLPIVPLGTYLVLSEAMTGMITRFEGIRIPFSAKSFVIAWIRSLLAAPFICSCIAGTATIMVDRHLNPGAKSSIFTIIASHGALLFAPYLITGIGRASESRAVELASLSAGVAQAHRVHTDPH